jgi:hypothetical protein
MTGGRELPSRRCRKRQEERLGQRIPGEPTHLAHLIHCCNRRGSREVLPLEPNRNVVLPLGEQVIGDRKEPHIGNFYPGLLLGLTNGTLLWRLSELQMPARRAPGSRTVRSLALQEEDLTFLSDQDCHADARPLRRQITGGALWLATLSRAVSRKRRRVVHVAVTPITRPPRGRRSNSATPFPTRSARPPCCTITTAHSPESEAPSRPCRSGGGECRTLALAERLRPRN